MNDIARHLGIYSVAEGVQDRQTAEALLKVGVRCAQGVYFNGPVPLLERRRDKREVASVTA